MTILKQHRWIAIVLGVFALVYLASLAFVYIDGDDAAIIAYHAVGRNPDLQAPYSPYISMFDRLLSILPAEETTLRPVTMILNSAAAVVVVLMILALTFDWLKIKSLSQRILVAVFVILAVPEFFYLGLLITPTLFAMAFILGAHLCLRHATQLSGVPKLASTKPLILFILSILIFAVGACIRWDTVPYGLIIVVDTILATGRNKDANFSSTARRIKLGVVWGALAIIGFVICIYISGYSIIIVVEILRFGATLSSSRPELTVSSIIALQTLFTPALVAALIAGLIVFIASRNPILLLTALGLVLVSPWITWGTPKGLMVAIPTLIATASAGFLKLWFHPISKYWRYASRAGMLALLLSIWFFGLRITYMNTLWGPGFELRPFDSQRMPTQIQLHLGSGAAGPTSEGPRPIYGHAAVLLAGEWKTFALELAEESENLFQLAISLHLPVLRLRGSNGFDTADLYSMGFTMRETNPNSVPRLDFIETRYFDNAQHDLIQYLRFIRSGELVDNADHVLELSQAYGRRYIVTGESSTLRHIYEIAPNALQQLGATSAILDLMKLSDAG